MTDIEFLQLVERECIRSDAYSLDREHSEAYVLRREVPGWSVYYAERGLKRSRRRFRSRADALGDLAERLIADHNTRDRA